MIGLHGPCYVVCDAVDNGFNCGATAYAADGPQLESSAVERLQTGRDLGQPTTLASVPQWRWQGNREVKTPIATDHEAG